MDINQIIPIAAVIIGVIVGFLLESLKSFLLKLKLTVEYDHSVNKADTMKLPLINAETGLLHTHGFVYYFRMRVINKGKTAAKSVEVFLNSLEKINDLATYEKQNFIPMNLSWSFGKQIDPNEKRLIYFPSISPGKSKHCDIGHIYNPVYRESNLPRMQSLNENEKDFRLDLAITTKSGFHVLKKGKYKIKFIIAAVNAKLVKGKILISLSGNWFDDEIEMLNKGAKIKIFM